MHENDNILFFEFISLNEINDILDYEINNNSERYSKSLIEKEFKIPFSKVIAGKINNKIIASSIIWEVDDKIEIHHLHVMEKYRRSGVGAKFLMFIIDFALKNNKSGILLEVKETNNPAINLYIKMGFAKIRFRNNYYKDGKKAIEMYKKL